MVGHKIYYAFESVKCNLHIATHLNVPELSEIEVPLLLQPVDGESELLYLQRQLVHLPTNQRRSWRSRDPASSNHSSPSHSSRWPSCRGWRAA